MEACTYFMGYTPANKELHTAQRKKPHTNQFWTTWKWELVCKFDIVKMNLLLIFHLYSYLYTLLKFCLLFFVSNNFTPKWPFYTKCFELFRRGSLCPFFLIIRKVFVTNTIYNVWYNSINITLLLQINRPGSQIQFHHSFSWLGCTLYNEFLCYWLWHHIWDAPTIFPLFAYFRPHFVSEIL